MGIEIAQIKNEALKAAALLVDGKGNQNGYIDDSEMSLFVEMSSSLLVNSQVSTSNVDDITEMEEQSNGVMDTFNKSDKQDVKEQIADIENQINAKQEEFNKLVNDSITLSNASSAACGPLVASGGVFATLVATVFLMANGLKRRQILPVSILGVLGSFVLGAVVQDSITTPEQKQMKKQSRTIRDEILPKLREEVEVLHKKKQVLLSQIYK